MPDLEKLHVKLGLSGTYWDRRPEYEIVFNGKTVKTGAIESDSDEVEYIEFDAEYDTESCCLEVVLTNKQHSDTVQNEDKTAILKDMLLNIVSLEIDEINLGQVPRNLSEYCPKEPVYWQGETVTVVRNCVNLGWNGAWKLSWTNPFYIWLLENM